MSLEALGNLGEFVSSIAVLVSLVYLAIQIKKSTETERTSTYRSIVCDFGQVNQILASDPNLNLLYARALEDFDAAPRPVQRALRALPGQRGARPPGPVLRRAGASGHSRDRSRRVDGEDR